MDASEAAIQELLFRMGFSSVVYEPDGNIPPDFVVDGRIAVEVRRLNQNFDDGSGMRGLEEVSAPLWQKIERLVQSTGAPVGNSWFVFFRFSRPVPSWKELGPQLRQALEDFQASAGKPSRRLLTLDNFEIDVAEASQPLESFFRMGGMSDRQAGGWVVAELISNIKHCAAEKAAKVAPHRGKYEEWWLALTNYTGFGLDAFDREQLQAHLARPDGWDKVLLLNPSEPLAWVEF